MRRKTLLGILLVLMLAVASRWLLVQNRPAPESVGTEIDMRFDYVLSGFQMRSFSADGKLTALLQSPSLTQAAVSLVGEIEEPRLEIPGDGQGNVALSADKATISSDQNTIQFNGSVLLQHDIGPAGVTTVYTDSLAFDIASHTARTSDHVKLVRQGMQLTGTGMEADIQSQRYRLLSKVEGFYER